MGGCWTGVCDRDPVKQRQLLAKLEQKRIKDEIENELKEDRKRRRKEYRVLLLGCGEAGKSTFIKQMRIIHSRQFTDEERQNYRLDIASNIISAINTLLDHVNDQDEFFLEYRDSIDLIRDLQAGQPEPEKVYSLAKEITKIWESTPVQNAYSRRNQFQIVESAKYFLTRIETVMEEGYQLTDNDIVQTRVKTIGINEYEFEMMSKKGATKRKIIMIDVGGQRSERRKWIHCFEDVTLIIFLAAVSEYDMVLEEDGATNRMEESLRLFRTILMYRWFMDKTVILFLNKTDLLREKIQNSHVVDYFKNFDGPKGDYDSALKFFSNSFENANQDNQDRALYIHPTCATDTENIKVVDTLVQERITSICLKNIGLN